MSMIEDKISRKFDSMLSLNADFQLQNTKQIHPLVFINCKFHRIIYTNSKLYDIIKIYDVGLGRLLRYIFI